MYPAQAVRDSEALRKAVEEVQPLQVKLGLRLAQSKPLYEAFRALRDSPEWDGLSEARKRVVDNELRDFVLGGVALEVVVLLVQSRAQTPCFCLGSEAYAGAVMLVFFWHVLP